MRFSYLAGRSILRFFSAGSRQQILHVDQEISQPAGSSPLPLSPNMFSQQKN
jgi:hypothetical protein